MFPFRSKKPDLPPFMTPEFKQYLELHGLLVDIKLGQSLMQLRLDRMSDQIAALQNNQTDDDWIDDPVLNLHRYIDPLPDDDFEAVEQRYAAQDVQEFMNLPEVKQGMADFMAEFGANMVRPAAPTRLSSITSRAQSWRQKPSIKEARRLLQLQHPEYASPAFGIDPLELLKKDWVGDSEANRPKEEGACS